MACSADDWKALEGFPAFAELNAIVDAAIETARINLENPLTDERMHQVNRGVLKGLRQLREIPKYKLSELDTREKMDQHRQGEEHA